MAVLGTIYAASPLDADDGTNLVFTNDTTETLTRALGDTPADFGTMTDPLTWATTYMVPGHVNDDYDFSVRIVNGATILAAADSGGTFTDVALNITATTEQTATAAFAYTNTTADKATWDGAVVELRQTWTKSKGSDAASIEVDYFRVTGNYTAGAVDYPLDISSGTFNVTGSSVTTKKDKKLSLTSGSVVVTGNTVSLSHGRLLDINSGSYTVSGNSVDADVARKLSLSSGAVAVTGANVDLTYTPSAVNYTLDCTTGSIVVSGGNIGLAVSRELSVNSGSIAVTGSNIDVAVARELSLTSGTYTINGNTTDLAVGRQLSLSSGSVSVTGSTTDLGVARKLSVNSGAISVTGSDVDLTYTPAVGNYVLDCSSGSILVTGASVTTTVDRSLGLSTGAYVITGASVDLTYTPSVSLSVSCTLVTVSGTPLTNLSAISWCWFDAVDPNLFIAPTDQGEVESTDGTGLVVVDIPNTTLTSGQSGTLILRSDDGSLMGAYELIAA